MASAAHRLRITDLDDGQSPKEQFYKFAAFYGARKLLWDAVETTKSYSVEWDYEIRIINPGIRVKRIQLYKLSRAFES
jgi:hypothetical protein